MVPYGQILDDTSV